MSKKSLLIHDLELRNMLLDFVGVHRLIRCSYFYDDIG
jgi:hypothetical protein